MSNADDIAALREQNARLQQDLDNLWQNPPQQQQPAHSCSRVAIRLPAFWLDKPRLWFIQAESQFTLSNIVNEVTKFHHVVSQLDQRTAFEVEDVIANPPPLNPYSFLRDKIIERLSASEEQRVRQLISAEELGDRKPSQFLRHLRSLAGTTIVQDNFLRQLWLPRLPPNVQAILASQAELTLDKLAELADKIMEITPCTPTFSVNTAFHGKNTENELLKSIAELQKQVAELSASYWRQHRYRSRNSNHSITNREESDTRKNANQKEGLCWYHYKFNQKAKKCNKPCTWSENGQSNQ